MKVYDEVLKRLKSGGWVLKRKGKHEVWKYSNGATFALSFNHKSYDKAMKDIARLEQEGFVIGPR